MYLICLFLCIAASAAIAVGYWYVIAPYQKILNRFCLWKDRKFLGAAIFLLAMILVCVCAENVLTPMLIQHRWFLWFMALEVRFLNVFYVLLVLCAVIHYENRLANKFDI